MSGNRTLKMGRSDSIYWTLRPWLTPGLENSHTRYARELQERTEVASRWLDIGCGHDFAPDWTPFTAPGAGRCWIAGIDMDLQALRAHRGLAAGILARGEHLPFQDSTFDLVSANMVLEHVESPDALFPEVYRVLRPGGLFLAHTPNARGYTTVLTRMVPARFRAALASRLQSRAEEDVYPTFYRANTAERLAALAHAARFHECRVEGIDSSPLFVKLAPLLVPEMILIRMIRSLRIDTLRPCLLAICRKQ